MNKIFKHSMMLLFSALALVFGSCTEEFEYTGATVSGEQVYFSNALSSTVNLDPDAAEVRIPVNRIQRSGALTVDLTVTTSENCAVSVPSSVAFADGDSVAYLTVTYDPSSIEMGHYDSVTVAIANADYTTPYGNSSYTFAIGLSEWKSVGTGLFRDVLMHNFYGLDEMTYNVEIEENILTPGVYRVVSPYGPGTAFYNQVVATGMMQWVGGDNTSMIINASDPDHVYVTGSWYTGTDDGMAAQGYGQMHLFSIVDVEAEAAGSVDQVKAQAPELFGTLRDGMISLPSMSCYVNFDGSMTPQGYVDTSNWAVALPGSSFVDYSSSFTYNGCFTNVAGDSYAEGTITLGDDVANAKYIVAGADDDVEAIIEGLADGSVEAEALTESGDVSIALEESGNYTMIVVTFDVEGNMRGSSTTSFVFTTSTTRADWQLVTTGTYYQSVQPIFSDMEPVFDQATYQANLYRDANNSQHYMISPWTTVQRNDEGDPYTFEFTLNSDATLSYHDVLTPYVLTAYENAPVYMSDLYSFQPDEQFYGSSNYGDNGIYYFGAIFYGYIQGNNGIQAGVAGAELDAFVPEGITVETNSIKVPYKPIANIKGRMLKNMKTKTFMSVKSSQNMFKLKGTKRTMSK